MDIKRSNRIKKAAAIAALVLVVGGASVAAETGNAGLFEKDIISADAVDTTVVPISTADDFIAFLSRNPEPGKTLTAKLTASIEVPGGYDKLKKGMIIYGNGNTITVTGVKTGNGRNARTDKKPLFKTIEEGAKIENVAIQADEINHDDARGVLCNINRGEIRYVDVNANVTAKKDNTGIICGENHGKIFGCAVTGKLNVEGRTNAGGICGTNHTDGIIERCSCEEEITFNDDAETVGGLCGLNSGKIYDCVFKGMLPIETTSAPRGAVDVCPEYGYAKEVEKWVWVEDAWFGHVEKVTVKKYYADLCNRANHSAREIGGLCGKMDDIGTIANTLYNGQRHVTKTGIDYIETHKDEADSNYEYKVVNGYECIGKCEKEENMANCFRIDTYKYDTNGDGNEDGTHFSLIHYHFNKYDSNHTPRKDYEYTDGTVVNELNAGNGLVGEEHTNVWVQGKDMPELNRSAGVVSYTAPTKLNRTYDDTTKPLVKAGKVDAGAEPDAFLYTLTPNVENSWSESIPEAKDAGQYRVYYKVVVEEGSRYTFVPIDNGYVDVTISPAELTVTWPDEKDRTFSYDEKNHSVVPTVSGYQGDDADLVKFTTTGDTVNVGKFTVKAELDSAKQDSKNYILTDEGCECEITKVQATAPKIKELKATYGDTLEKVALPTNSKGVFEWKDSKETLVGNVGKHTFKVIYTPNDTNYLPVELDATVYVSQKKIKLQWTGKHEYTYGDEIKITADSSDIFSYDRPDTKVTVTIPEERNASETEYVAKASVNNGNYEIDGDEFKYKIKKATPSYSEALEFTVPYGTKLGDIDLPDVDGGKLSWVNNDYVGDVTGETGRSFDVMFVPDNQTNYTVKTLKATVNVTPKEIEVEWTGDTEYSYGTAVNLTADKKNEDDILAEDESNGVEISVTGNTETAVGEYTATATINSGNYTITNSTCPYSIVKAKPSVQITETVSAVYGQKLGELDLPTVANGTLSWKDEDKEVLVGDKGEHVVEVTFTPDESASYETVTANVTVVVAAKKIKLQWTGEHEYTYGDEIKITADSSDIFDYDRTNETKTQVSVTIPEGRNASETEYVATASINNENYTIEDNEFKYRINKATLAYSEPLYLDAVYGQKVSELPLREVTDGKYEWVNAEEYVGDVTKEGERNTRKLIFKPADTVNFNELEVDALIKVTPKEIEVEWTGDTEYYYGTEVNLTAEKKNEDDILAEDESNGVEISVTGNTETAVGEYTATATINSGNYTITNPTRPYSIIKAKPSVQITETVSAIYGQQLGELTLPTVANGTLSWKDEDKEVLVGDKGEHVVEVTFTPDESASYETVTANVTVVVAAKKIKLQWTGEHEYTYGDEIKITADSSDIFDYDRTNETKTQVSVTIPEGRNASETEYVATASINNENYTIEDNEFKYRINKATLAYSEPLYLDAVYGQKVSELPLREVTDGKYEWVNAEEYVGDVTKEGERNTRKLIFKPADTVNFNELEVDALIKVTPKEIEVEWTGDTEYYYGTEVNLTADKKNEDDILAEDESNGIEISVTGNTETAVGEYTATATINSGNYTITNPTRPYSIIKAKPSVQITETVSAVYGQKLGELDFPTVANGTLSWKEEDKETLVGDKGEHEVAVTFTPSEPDCYETVEANVTVVVAAKPVNLTWSKQNEFNYGEKIIITADSNDILAEDKENDVKVTVTRDSKDGNVGNNYTATASINSDNYTIANSTFVYSVKAVAPSVIITPETLTYKGESQNLVTFLEKTGASVDFDVKFGDKTYSVTGGGVPTGTDAGTYEITYTIKPDSNHVISDADAKKTIRVTINPKQINVDYSPLSFTYGTPVVINAAPKDENAIARRDNGKIAITVTPDNDNNVGKHTATAEINNSNYTISPSTVVYEITQAKADPAAVPTPSLHSIEYGQQAQEAELTEGWNCPVVNSSERPNAGNHYGQAVYEADYHNYDYSNVPGYDPTTGKVTAEIKLEVTAKDLHAYWSESGEFVYNGKKQIPAIDNSKTKGFVEENNDSQYYVIKPKSVDPEKYDCTSAGAQKVTAELVTNDEEKRPVTNYNLIIEENDYNISTATIKDIDKVGTTVTYGDNTSSVKAVREALKAEILKKVPDFDKNYIILDDFGVENKTEDDVLVVDTYSSRIHYTCIKQDAATGETKADSNYEGWFTATVDVLPKEIAVQWKSNAEFNKETGNNEIVFGVIPDVKPELAAGALCNRDKDEKLDVKVSPADKNGVGDYTVTASLDDKNYKLSNTEYKYTIIKATPSIKLEDKYTATYGDKLSDIADQLPKDDNGTYTWKNENAPVGDAGENTHIVVYKPNDDKNNNIVETEVTVKVNPKEVNLIWNIDNGEKFTYNGEAQNVDAYADLNDVFDKDEPSFKLDITADDLVNAGENHKAVATIRDENNNAKNYKIVEGKESITFDILKSSSLQDLNYSETYEYGTTAKEIFDDLFAKHFGDFSAFAEQYSVDPESVEVYKNGKKIETEKLKNYAKSCLKAQDLIFEGDIIKQLNQLGASFYNKPDFNVLNNYNDYMQVKTLVDTNRDRIKSFINAGVLPEADKYRKLITLFEKYEAVKEAENVMQEVGDYKITVNYNRMADEKEQSLTRFLKLSNNYHPAALTAEVKITPCVIENIFADIDSRPYNGGTDVSVNNYTLISKKDGKNKEWNLGGYLTNGAEFVSADAGTDKINAELTLTNENFCFGFDEAGKPVMTKKFHEADTDGCITKAEFPYTVNLEGFAGERLSTVTVPGVIHGTFRWNDTNTVIAEGSNVIDASEYTFTPDAKDPFNRNYDVVLTVNVNGVKKPVETVVETAVETVIVTEETKPSVTEVSGKPVTTAETSAKVSEAQTTPAGTETTAESGAVTTTVTETTTAGVTKAETTDLPEITLPASTTAKFMGEVTEAPAIVTKPAVTTAVTTAATTAKTEVTTVASTTAETKAVTTAKVTEAEAAGVTTAETKPVTTAKVTEATTAGVTTAETKAATTATVTEATTAGVTTAETKAVTTAKVTEAETAGVTTAETKAVTTAKVTEAETAGVTTAETKPVTTANVTEAITAGVTTAETKAVTTAKVTEAEAAGVTTAETKAVTTAKVTEAETAGVTTAETKAVTTAKVTEAEAAGVTTAETKPVTTAKVTEAETAGVTTAETKAVTTAKVTEAETAGVTTAETKPVTTANVTEATTAETKPVTTAGVTTTVTEAGVTTTATETETAEVTTSATTAEITETPVTDITTDAVVTTASTTPGLIDIDLPEITTGVMGDVTENPAVVTEAVTTAQTEAVTTEAAKTGLDNIIDIIINNPDKVKQEVHEDGKISINGEQIRLALEDKMFFQGTESFDYPVRLKDFNAEKAYFDYAGFGFELPEGYTVDPESLSTDLKGNIKYYAPDSLEALALSAKTGYAAKGGYVVFRGVETRNLASDAVLFTVKIKVSDTLDTCISKIGVSALYGRLTENSKLNADGTVEPHVAFIDNNAGDQLYTKETSTVSMGVKGDVNLDGKVTQVDATVILREILSLEVFKKSLLADNINLHDGTPEEGVALSHFLGNVNQSPNGLFTQIDATSILRGILERDMNGDKIVTEQIWKKVTNK